MPSWGEIRQAFRRLGRTPGFAVLGIVTLAIGIGVATALFGVVNAVMLKPLGYPGLDRVVNIQPTDRGVRRGDGLAGAKLESLRGRGLRSLTQISASHNVQSTLLANGTTRLVATQPVTGPYFDLFRVSPIAGRLLLPEQDDEAVVISERLWREAFDGRPDAIGARVAIGGRPMTLVGVAPAWFRGTGLPHLISVDAWIQDRANPTARHELGGLVFARLTDGFSFGEADAELRTLSGLDPSDDGFGVAAQAAWRGMVPPPLVPIAALFAAAGGLIGSVILLIATANAINLLLARAASRGRELAVRRALGASDRDLRRLLTAEGMALALPGGAVGGLLSVWLLRLATTFTPPPAGALVVRVDTSPNWLVFAVCLFVTGIAAFLLGRVGTRLSPSEEPGRLLSSGTVAGDVLSADVRGNLISWQMASATALLVVAAVGLRAATGGIGARAAFPAHTAVGALALSESSLSPDDRAAFARRFLDAGGGDPRAPRALMSDVPIAGGGIAHTLTADGGSIRAQRIEVSGDALAALGLQIRAGASLTATAVSNPVVVDANVAAELWPGGQAVGRVLRLSRLPGEYHVTGVVDAVPGLAGPAPYRRFVYTPLEPGAARSMLAVTSDPASDDAAVARLRQAVASSDLRVALKSSTALRHYAHSRATNLAASAAPLIWLGGLAAVLSVAGLYAVLMHTLAVRRREFGIRRALGAGTRQLMALVFREMGRFFGRGIAGGLVAAGLLTALLPAEVLLGLSRADLAAFLGVPAALAAVTLAALVPSTWRAARASLARQLSH